MSAHANGWQRRANSSWRGSRSDARLLRAARPVEPLEKRLLLATVTVSSSNDLVNGNTTSIAALIGANGGDGISLREAITAANNTPNSGGPDVINFQIPGTGVHTIGYTQVMPSITDPVTIDATTESDYAGLPRVELDGVNGNQNGLLIQTTASGSTIRGLAITRFAHSGILILSSNNVVEACHLGVSATGTLARGNLNAGVYILDQGPMTGNRVGGTTAAQRNVISANTSGVVLDGANVSGASIQGNYIGTDATGLVDLGNTSHGVLVSGSANNTIGGAAAGARNVISGNEGNGIKLVGSTATGNTVEGNYIGTDVNGSADLGNSFNGVEIEGASGNTIGGTAAGARNVISGNTLDGVRTHTGANANIIAGNYLGLAANGDAALGNTRTGVAVFAGTGNTIGSTTAGGGNVISANVLAGIFLDAFTNNTVIQGNLIGTDATGTLDRGNASHGIEMLSGGTTIGGTVAGARNVISGNNQNGIRLLGISHTIQGNYIGTNAAGTAAVPNSLSGIDTTGSAEGGHLIGGAVAGAGNVLSGNGVAGVLISGTTMAISVQGNFIGTNAAGTAAISNVTGVEINNAPNILIGGTTAAARNVISGNSTGITVTGAGATGTQIRGNYIGTNAAGDAATAGSVGVRLDTPNVAVGGTDAGAGNVISGQATGINVTGLGDVAIIQGNRIGTNAAGTAALGNGTGIVVEPGADFTLIGGAHPAARNIISGNSANGIRLSDPDPVTVRGNYIGTDVTGMQPLGNGISGIEVVIFTSTPLDSASIDNNVIAACGAYGISVGHAVGSPVNTPLSIVGNRIGTGADGTTPMGNGLHGIRLSNVAAGAAIGGSPALSNVIAHNGGNGVAVFGSSSAAVRLNHNSIHSNALLGIDLGGDGVTANDANDSDSGANGLQNFPVVSSATVSAGKTVINGTLNTTASTDILLELFRSTAVDSSGHGEGQTHVHQIDLATNASGNLSFSFELPTALPIGSFVTATATAASTSEFSQAVQVVEVPSFSVTDVTVTEGHSGTVAATFTVNRSGNLSGASTVLYATANGSAVAPADYETVPMTQLSFAAGDTSKTVTVLVNGDTADELNETFNVNLSNAVNGTIGDAQGVGTIVDDDPSSGSAEMQIDPANPGLQALVITGTLASDTILLQPDGGQIRVIINGIDKGSFAPTGRVYAYGLEGSDVVTFDVATPMGISYDGDGGSDALNLNAGSYTFDGDVAAGSNSLAMSIGAAASVQFGASQNLASLNVAGSASLTAGGAKVLRTAMLAMQGGSLDLADNDLIVDYSSVSPVGIWTGSAYDGVTGYIAAGRIFSSLASGQLKKLAVAEAREALGITGTQTATFSGQSVDSTAVLVKFTWGGDATLDGKINIDDYGRIDGNVAQSGSVFGWFNGDFNLDGKINIDDYGIIDGNINQQDEVL